jgi:heme oxygenase
METKKELQEAREVDKFVIYFYAFEDMNSKNPFKKTFWGIKDTELELKSLKALGFRIGEIKVITRKACEVNK